VFLAPNRNYSSLNFALDHSLELSYRPCMRKFLQRYWGYIALALVIMGWATHAIGYMVIAIISLLALVYFLFQAPLTCGAETRQGLNCRKNSNGLLMGCSIRQHKWGSSR
jgi:hypothetical protein